MPTNFFLPFGVAAGANAWSDAAYNGSQQQQTGIVKGIVPSGLMTKAWRQSSVPASAVAQIIVDHGLVDAADDGNVSGFKANLRMAVAAMLAGANIAVDQSATPNLLTVVLDPVPPTLTTYRGILVRVANTNTGAVTLSLNSLGSKAVVRKSGLPLVAGDLVQGQFVHLIYDLAPGQWVVAGSVASDTNAVLDGRNITGSNKLLYGTAGTFVWTVPASVTRARFRIWGAGGGGGGANGSSGAGSGGGGGGFAEGVYTVTPGQNLTLIVGAGGTAGPANPAAGQTGGTGGTTSASSFCSATGGTGGFPGISFISGVAGSNGAGTGGQTNESGTSGGLGFSTGSLLAGGQGGAPPNGNGFGPLNVGSAGQAGQFYGAGGNGAAGANAPGGVGGAGRIEVYY